MQFMQGNWPAGRLQHLQHFNEKVRMQCCLLCSVESVAKLVGWGISRYLSDASIVG